MVENVNRQCVLDFLRAYYSGDIEGTLACCDDDFDTITYVGSSRVDLQACKLEYSIVSPK